ncbi:hypothetical protein DFH11DRAFT_1567050 [Phellopilus nigrolimitatus]|nr:hypothetical protein DFH11DRAFT_1567050 [Phellopilus nigrolimitatus]
MNPTRPPVTPYQAKAYSNDATTNPLYGMHVNAGGAYGSVGAAPVQRRANTSPTSFYPSHLAHHASSLPPPLPPGRPGAGGPSSLPPSLMPGSGARARSDLFGSVESSLFFQTSTPPLPSPSIAPIKKSAHPYAQDPYSSRKPPLPPKPQLRRNSSNGPFPEQVALPPKVPPKNFVAPIEIPAPLMPSKDPTSPEDHDELVARILELSLQDTGSTGQRELEEAILARVMKESMTPVIAARTRGSASSSSPSSTSSASTGLTAATSRFPHSFEDGYFIKGKERRLSEEINLDELDRQEQEAQLKQLEMDEEFARTIARDEVSDPPVSPACLSISSSSPQSSHGAVALQVPTPPSGYCHPPLYESALNSDNPAAHTALSTSSSMNIGLPPKGSSTLGRAYGSVGVGAGVPASPDRLGRSVSAQAAFPSATERDINPSLTHNLPNRSPVAPANTRPNTVIPVQNIHDESPGHSPSTPMGKPKLGLNALSRALASGTVIRTGQPIDETTEEDGDLENDLSPISSVDCCPTSQLISSSFVEEELLMGVSIGFNAPSMSPTHLPMQGPIPNILSLPYGKSPPLHIQAPNWKQLLKLLTRLSESRIEPTVEALAGTKMELRLRTVVQFMKLHHSASDWRAGDSDLSKCFTIPATNSMPYPTLPMALPDFAMYLHAVLEDSRRAAHDTSGGLRRLAKMVDSFYPATNIDMEGLGPEAVGPDRRGVGGFFRRALGRTEKNNQGQRGGNADTYEFITPFRIDEYR